MKTYKLTLFDGHPIVGDNGNLILLDTGAPISIHSNERLMFMYNEYEVSTNYLGLTAESLSELIGMKITTLLAADILSDFVIIFDYKNEEVIFGDDDLNLNGESISIRRIMGVPTIALQIDGNEIRCFLDTGAKLSYLNEDATVGYVSKGIAEDFYPGAGKFETQTYDVVTNIGNHTFHATYGNLPMLFQLTLAIAGTGGIIGYDLFNNFKVLIDLKREVVKINKN